MCEIFCKLFTSFLMEINLLRFWILSFRNYYNKKLSNVYANFVVGSVAERSSEAWVRILPLPSYIVHIYFSCIISFQALTC